MLYSRVFATGFESNELSHICIVTTADLDQHHYKQTYVTSRDLEPYLSKSSLSTSSPSTTSTAAYVCSNAGPRLSCTLGHVCTTADKSSAPPLKNINTHSSYTQPFPDTVTINTNPPQPAGPSNPAPAPLAYNNNKQRISTLDIQLCSTFCCVMNYQRTRATFGQSYSATMHLVVDLVFAVASHSIQLKFRFESK